MTRHSYDETTHDAITTTGGMTTRATVCACVEAALVDLDRQAARLGPIPTTDAGWVTWSATLWRIGARRAGWWRVLLVDDQRTHALHPVHRRAAQMAHQKEHANARFWREAVQDWQARAEQRPTSDAAGSLSNWHELEATP